MQQIIDGKIYDTENAKQVEIYGNDALYRTKKGTWFFLHIRHSNQSYVEPISAEEAFAWLYKHSYANAIKVYFPNKIEDA